jgi:hypothetical protein
VGRSGHEDDVSIGLGGDLADEVVALLATALAPGPDVDGAAMRFVDNDELGTMEQKVGGPTIGLDEVGGDDEEGVSLKDRHPDRKIAFERLDGVAEDQHGVDMKLAQQFALPLFGEVSGAQDGKPADFAPVEQFAGDEGDLDGLADAHVIGDEQPDGIKAKSHDEGDELVGAGLDSDAGEAAEGASGGAGGEAGGFAEEAARAEVAHRLARGERKGRRLHRFDGGQNADDLFIETPNGAHEQEFGGGFGEDDPFAPTGVDESAGLVERREAHDWGVPKMSGWESRRAFQSAA